MFTLHKMKSLSVRPLYSDSISTITKDEQLKSFSLSCHKEDTSESWSKATAAQPFILKKTKNWTVFCRTIVSKSIKTPLNQVCWNKILDQRPGTESTHPHTELEFQVHITSTQQCYSNWLPINSKLAKEKNGSSARIFAEKDFFTQRTNTALVTPCSVKHSYLRTDSHCSLMGWFYLV